MPKKSFKDNTDHLDAFFTPKEVSKEVPSEETSIEDTIGTHQKATMEALEEISRGKGKVFENAPESTKKKKSGAPTLNSTSHRINIGLSLEQKGYLKEASWVARKSMSRYLSDLIDADMRKK